MWQGERRLGVVGLGRLGSCLVRALVACGAPLTAVATSSEAGQQFARDLGSGISVVPVGEICEHADTIIITVPDGQTEQVSARLTPGMAHAVAHTSGALDASALAHPGHGGARVGVFHPLQSFPRGAPPETFSGIQIGIDAEPAFALELHGIAAQLGAETFSLAGVDRALYHAAAVFAGNYLAALHVLAADTWEAAGLPKARARAALAPLTLGAATALARDELPQALTGPLVRGDIATVQRHLAALAPHTTTLQAYRLLARELLRLPLGIDELARRTIEALIEESPTSLKDLL